MKRIAGMLITVLLVLCMVFALPLNASAASSAAQDGLEVAIATDKDVYSKEEDIQVTVTIKNTNDYIMTDISVETLIPEGLEIKAGTAQLAALDLAAGATETVSLTAKLKTPIGGDSTGGTTGGSTGGTTGGSTGGSSTATGGNASGKELPTTGDKSNIFLWILIFGVSTCGIVFIANHKKATKIISLCVCVAIIAATLGIGAFTSNHDILITVDKTITVDGNTYTITSTVNKFAEDVELDSSYNVTFALNDGSNGSYEVREVITGSTVAQPIAPERVGYNFIGWFIEPECETEYNFSNPIVRDITVYALWEPKETGDFLFGGTSGGGTVYSITGIEMEGNRVSATINVDSACTLKILFKDEETEDVIATVTTQTPEYCEMTPVSVLVEERLPEKYIVEAILLDENGNPLCDRFVCRKYTTAYEEFEEQDIDDFADENTVNFDNDRETNFGVLAEDVIIVESSDTVNKLNISSQPLYPDDYDGTQDVEYETYYMFENPDEQITGLEVGDKIYAKGTQCLIKIASIETSSDGTVIMTASSDVELPDFYDVIDVDIELDINEAHIEGTDPAVMWDVVDAETAFTLGGTIDFTPVDWLKISGRLNGTGKFKLEITYDVVWFGEDYFYISVVSELEVNVTADVKVIIESPEPEGKEITEISLGRWTVPTPIPGLTLTTSPKIPLEWEVSAGATFDFNSKMTSGFIYTSTEGKQNIDEKERTIKLGAEGEAWIKFGPKVTLSVEFCKDVLKASLSAAAGIEAKAQTEITATDTTAEEKHDCTLCIEGTVKWYAEVNAKLSYKILKDILEGELASWDIVKVEGNFPISLNFYISLINAENSVHGGRVVFGWGECPNKAYRITFVVKDVEGNEKSGINVLITKNDGSNVASGVSRFTAYLYNGDYKASCNVNGLLADKTFTVSDDAQTVTIQAEAQGVLSGKVCKASDRITAIPGATVKIYKNNTLYATKATNATGNYSVDLTAGEYKIVISAVGYLDFTSYATVRVNDTTYLETFLMVEESDAESGIAKGRVLNSLTGIGAPQVTIKFKKDWNVGESAETVATAISDENGNYSVELPLGNYTAYASKVGYTTGSFNIIVQEGTTDNQNGTITPVVSGDNYLITLEWGANPRDVDSHVYGTLSNGSNFHVYYGDESQYDGDVEVCNLDYDDTDGYGPEHITLNTTTDRPYYYYLHKYAGSGSLSSSSSKVTIEQGNTVLAVFYVPTNLGADDYWNVFAIKDGEIIINNTITNAPNVSYAD